VSTPYWSDLNQHLLIAQKAQDLLITDKDNNSGLNDDEKTDLNFIRYWHIRRAQHMINEIDPRGSTGETTRKPSLDIESDY
jgi:hypothetical protein